MQALRVVSVPRHWTSSNQITLLPLVNPEVTAIAPTVIIYMHQAVMVMMINDDHDDDIIIVYSVLTMMKIVACFITSSRKSKLPAHYSCINIAPGIITDSAPGIIVADLHSSSSSSPSLKSDRIIGTKSSYRELNITTVSCVCTWHFLKVHVAKYDQKSNSGDRTRRHLNDTHSHSALNNSRLMLIRTVEAKKGFDAYISLDHLQLHLASMVKKPMQCSISRKFWDI